jgi:hypothetical protein
MKRFIVLAILPLIFAFSAATWKPVELAGNITVSMPGDPTTEESNGVTLKKLKMEDGSELSGGANDLTSKGVTADMLKQMIESGAFGGQIKSSIEAQGATVTGESEGEYKGMKYYQFDIEVTKDGQVQHKTTRSVFFGATTVQLIYKHGKEGKNDALRDQFFNSLEVKS